MITVLTGSEACQTLVSLASLVKSNNGIFKSQKQSQFLHSKANDGVAIVGDVCYGHSYFTEYHLDADGVLKVVRLNKAGRKVLWERAGSVRAPIQVTKELNRLNTDAQGSEHPCSRSPRTDGQE